MLVFFGIFILAKIAPFSVLLQIFAFFLLFDFRVVNDFGSDRSHIFFEHTVLFVLHYLQNQSIY